MVTQESEHDKGAGLGDLTLGDVARALKEFAKPISPSALVSWLAFMAVGKYHVPPVYAFGFATIVLVHDLVRLCVTQRHHKP